MIGILIKQLREERGMSQKSLAAEIKMGTTAINNYENGHRVPDVDTLIRLADFFEVTPNYLLGKSKFRNDTEAEAALKQSKDVSALLSYLRPNVRVALLPALENLLLASGDAMPDYAAAFLISFSRVAQAYTRGMKAADGIIAKAAAANRLRTESLSKSDGLARLLGDEAVPLLETLEGLSDVLSEDVPSIFKVALSDECAAIRQEADGLYRDIPPLISEAIEGDCNAARLRAQGDSVPRRAGEVPDSGPD